MKGDTKRRNAGVWGS